MAITGWLLHKSATSRIKDPKVDSQISKVSARICVCEVGQLEQLYSARSAKDYDERLAALVRGYEILPAPPDLLKRTILLQRDLAHHRGLWHRLSIPDLFMAETALYHNVGILHVDRDFERIAEVRPLVTQRLTV